MLHFLTYQTPSKFLPEFEEHSSYLNLRSIKIISSCLLFLSSIVRLLRILFPLEVSLIKGADQLSLNNWLQIIGSISFLTMSSYALKKDLSLIKQKIITLAFVTYMLTMAFNISYIISQYNTKNTLFMFLVGIVVASLFFTIEFKQMKFIVIYIVAVYLAATLISAIPIQEKLVNFVAGIILGIILLSFSRYSYFFKSNHFIQIKDLEDKNRKILILNNQKSEILSFVAHDLRTPLNNIEALSKLLLLEDNQNTEINMIANSTQQAKNIINDLIEIVKTEQTDVPKENIQLKQYLKNIIDRWANNTTRKIQFTPYEGDVKLSANASKLERVFDNLISNALKFSSSDKPINIVVNSTQDMVLIDVIDFGIGIPAELQPYVFDQFSKASRKGLQGENSIGLGLHISRKIIEQHKGELFVSSKENEGTTFTIKLPATD